MIILNQKQVDQKIYRIALQILENNLEAEGIILAGINNAGYLLGEKISNKLTGLTEKKIQVTRIKLDPAKPLSSEVTLEIDLNDLKGKTIIIVDDVANTGRTIFYAIKPLLNILPKKVEVAVLVDRTHKSFPIKADYVGISLATTLKENIKVNLKGKATEVHLS